MKALLPVMVLMWGAVWFPLACDKPLAAIGRPDLTSTISSQSVLNLHCIPTSWNGSVPCRCPSPLLPHHHHLPLEPTPPLPPPCLHLQVNVFVLLSVVCVLLNLAGFILCCQGAQLVSSMTSCRLVRMLRVFVHVVLFVEAVFHPGRFSDSHFVAKKLKTCPLRAS